MRGDIGALGDFALHRGFAFALVGGFGFALGGDSAFARADGFVPGGPGGLAGLRGRGSR